MSNSHKDTCSKDKKVKQVPTAKSQPELYQENSNGPNLTILAKQPLTQHQSKAQL